ncbi:extracellular solute-binding protein [Halorientalis pallida]|nr:extracellular solute-binding protein [Halorientalis pallida]
MSQRTNGSSVPVSRRSFLAAGGAAAITTAGCLGSSGSSSVLRVSTWSGTNETIFKNVVKPRYEEATGNTLEVVGNWQGILSKIRQSPADDPPFDVTVGVSRTHYRGRQNDLWTPVRYENLTHSDQLKSRLRGFPAAEQAVPVAYGVHCYVYDEDAIEWTPESWADIRSEAATGVALPSDYWLKLLMMAALISDDQPLAEEVYDQSTEDRLFDIVDDVPVETFYSGSQGLWTALSQGLATVGHNFFAYGTAKDRSTETLNLGITVPERTTGYVDYYQIVRGTDDREAAEEFLDFLIKPETQTAYAQEFNLGMANTEAEYPELTRENVPTTNEDLQTVAFQNFARVADYAPEWEQRFRELVQNS